jgi:DNA helicase II / ATP-dependent DNA helicase PcrA
LKIELCEKRKGILAEAGHLLVTGGPGSGKTTIALLKAQAVIAALRAGQQVLFLSFSRAAVRQVMVRCKSILSRTERQMIEVQTYHSFCLELLKSHGRLLAGKVPRIIFPDAERLERAEFEGDWDEECARRAQQDTMFLFSQFAGAAADLLEGCAALRTLVAAKYPLIIVDEFQDTDDDQWRLVAALSKTAAVFCLADPDQSIFQYEPKVDPLRIEKATAFLKPKVIDLAGENHRSPNSGILTFADAVLKNCPLPKVPEVAQYTYQANAFDSVVHAAVLWMIGQLRKSGLADPTVAVLCRSNGLVAEISAILSEKRPYKTTMLPSLEHDVLWDAELSAAAAAVLASILEWKDDGADKALARTLKFISAYYRLKNATDPSNSAKEAARKFSEASAAAAVGGKLKTKAAKELAALVKVGTAFAGDPVADWKAAQKIMAQVDALAEIGRQVRLVRLFRATDALGRGLAELWLAAGNYRTATILIKRILDQERLISLEQDPRGCLLMNIHKSKGKEFDGVVLVEGAYKSFFFDDKNEKPPYPQSRRLLRVALTRARYRAAIVRWVKAVPLIG